MGERAIQQTTRWDWFAYLLFTAYCVEAILGWVLYQKIQENFDRYRYLKTIVDSDSPAPKTVACIYGEPIGDKSKPLGKDQTVFIDEIKRMLRVADPILVSGKWTHSEKRGKNSTTITDRTIDLFFPLTVHTSSGDFHVQGFPQLIYSNRETSVKISEILRKLSPRSSSLKVTYFNPRKVYVMGEVQHNLDGTKRVLGDTKKPLIVSELSRNALISSFFFTLILQTMALAYLAVTFVVRLQTPLKKKFEQFPAMFFVFDSTAGSEILAMILFIGYLFGGAFLLDMFPGMHAFNSEQRFGIFCLGFFALVHISKGVEFFHLANKQDGFLYEVSRGFFSESKKRVANLQDLAPIIDSVRGSKGAVSYIIRGHGFGGVFDLTDKYSNRQKPADILEEFRAFKALKDMIHAPS